MNPHREHGFGLLDALIGVGILAAGVLVLLAAVNRGQANARELRETQTATELLQDLADRMHLNRHVHGQSVANLYHHSFTDGLPSSVACSDEACDAARLAQHDLSAWARAVADQLPQGRFAIVNSSQSQDLLAVMLAWQARGDSAPPALSSGLTALTCPSGQRCLMTHIRP